MRSVLLALATRLVRGWTRFYTHGLPRAERSARQAEIDSDLWEFEHDPEAPQRGWAATQVLARLLFGLRDDLAWRMDAGADGHRAPVRALAEAGVMTGPRRISAFGLAATIHVVVLSAVLSLASLGPAPLPLPGTAAARAGTNGVLANASLRNQRVKYERGNASAARMSVQSVANPVKPGAFSRLGAVAAAVAARVGLITPPRPAAQGASSSGGSSPSRNEPVASMAAQSVAPPGRVQALGAVRAMAVAMAARVGLLTPPHQTAQAASQSPDRFVARVLQNRFSLSVTDRQLSGAGAQVLRSAIAQSRFVLLGENHGLVQTAELGTAICNAANPERFHVMAIEEGPLAAAELEKRARRQDGLAQLAALERAFPRSINIYRSREEFKMLQQCTRAGQGDFHMWGLNQEALGAAGLILSRILESRPGETARPVMRQLLQQNEEAYRRAVHSGGIGDLFMLSADDRDLARGAADLQDGSAEARSLFAWLIESHEINRVPPMDYDNARRRERLMKTLFAANYARAAATAAMPPWVLLKLGAYHIYRGLNPVRGSGVGNYIAEFAQSQGAPSLHIRLMPVKGSQPIYPRVGQPAQLRPFTIDDDPQSRHLEAVLSNVLPSDWTLFDLRPLRRYFNALPGGVTNPELATLVFGIDMLIVAPEGTPSTEIH